jgi:hypothetical protein
MSHLVKVAAGYTGGNVNVAGKTAKAGDVLTLTDAEFASLPASSYDGDPLIDLGEDVVGANVLSIPITLANMPAGAGDVVTNVPLQAHGRITQVVFVVTAVGAGAGATRVLNLEIGTPGVNLTGGVLTLTLANTATVGAVVAGTAITAGNEFSDNDVLSVEVAAGTVFTGGEGVLLITIE